MLSCCRKVIAEEARAKIAADPARTSAFESEISFRVGPRISRSSLIAPPCLLIYLFVPQSPEKSFARFCSSNTYLTVGN